MENTVIRITHLGGEQKLYEVRDAYLCTVEGVPMLAMARLSDGEYGFIPLDAIQKYERMN